MRYQPPLASKDATGQFAELSRVLDAREQPPAFAPSSAAIVQVGAGETKRLAPRAAGQTVILPASNETNYGALVTLLVDGTLGTCKVKPISGTVDGATSFTLVAGRQTLLIFMSDGAGRWLSQRTGGFPTASTSLVYSGDSLRRAALTGEVTASQNSNATVVTRSTNFQTSPWTGNHKFNAELRLGTLHTEANAAGAVNITLTAGATRILLTSTAAVTIGTISGAVDGRVVVFEHVRASGAGDVTFTHAVTTDGIACPGSANLTLTGNRACCVLVCRDDVWRVIAHTN
jgi:hypothetical protein